jgi:RNA polymerase sigma-70 factor (ECF subfamily)
MASHPANRAEPLDRRVQAVPAALPTLARERELVARVRAGDERAFDTLFRSYYRPMCGFVVGFVGSVALAEELVQDVFASVWERRATWDVRESARSYLYALVRNHALNHLRRRRIESRWTDSATRGDVPIGMGQGMADAEERLSARELHEAIARALETLPPRCREVFTLRRDHHLTVPETAAALGVSVKRIEALLTRTYAVLRAALEPYR